MKNKTYVNQCKHKHFAMLIHKRSPKSTKNVSKASSDGIAIYYYSMVTIVNCFGGQKWKWDFAYR